MNGESLGFKGRPPKKPLELLQVVIALGGADVSIAGILDALWEEAINFYKKAVSYYKGSFLSGENTTPWVISARERLKNQFLFTIRRLGFSNTVREY